MCVMFGAFALGNAAPNLQYLSTARGAAHAVYAIIDQVNNLHIASSSSVPTPVGTLELLAV